jgi:hypothetical protein
LISQRNRLPYRCLDPAASSSRCPSWTSVSVGFELDVCGLLRPALLRFDVLNMALLPILKFPDPRLHKVAKPVAAVDERVRQLVADMLETMYASEGIGLAATQVDVHERVIVMDTSEGRQ